MEFLELKKVQTHNLKNFNLTIPLYNLVVITGPSGAGKSSLAFNTIAEEGKKRLLQILNVHKGINLNNFENKAQITSSFPPVIALPQGIRNWFPYKTVREFLLLDSFFAFFFAEEGEFKCPHCNRFSKVSSLNHLYSWYQTLKEGTKFYFLLPMNISSKGIEYLISQGWSKFIIDGKEVDLSEEAIPSSFKEVYLVLDRLVKEAKTFERLLEDVRQSTNLSKGKVVLKLLEDKYYFFNFKPYCIYCEGELITYWLACPFCKGLGYKEKKPCSHCEGLKLHPKVLESKLWGVTVKEILNFSLKELANFLKELFLDENFKKRILDKFNLVFELGLENLNVSQPVFKLSLGEKKLLELLFIFSLDLNYCLYILDEPSLGLDLEKRIKILKLLKKIIANQNSVILVEHDPFLISHADFVIELGPEGGDKGGYLIKAGRVSDFLNDCLTLTGTYLSGKKRIISPFKIERSEKVSLKLGTQKIELLKGSINLIYGKVGSGKTEIFKNLAEVLKNQGKELIIVENESYYKRKEELVITYTGIWQELREILVQLPFAKIKGFTKNHFSFFTKEGSCKGCKGKGQKIWEEEDFSFKVICEECLGKRLNSEVLSLEYKGFKLAEILDFSVKEALEVFSSVYKVRKKLELANDLGLSYLRLSQELQSLSGGEFARLSVVRELSKKENIEYLFLSFPLQGLHLKDVEALIKWLENVLKMGITIVILEVNPLVFFIAHWMLSVDKGQIKFQGQPKKWLNTLKIEKKEKITEFYGKFFNIFKN